MFHYDRLSVDFNELLEQHCWPLSKIDHPENLNTIHGIARDSYKNLSLKKRVGKRAVWIFSECYLCDQNVRKIFSFSCSGCTVLRRTETIIIISLKHQALNQTRTTDLHAVRKTYCVEQKFETRLMTIFKTIPFLDVVQSLRKVHFELLDQWNR